MTHIMVFKRQMSDRLAAYIDAAIKAVDREAECIPAGPTPTSPAYIIHSEPDIYRIDTKPIRDAATKAVATFQRLNPRAEAWQ